MFNKKLVKVMVDPFHESKFDVMKEGSMLHVDRKYTYDIIPLDLLGGLLFQGIHRPPKDYHVEIELLSPATIYFFFHSTANGDYDKIFDSLDDWELCNIFPQYDINNGKHGLTMIMYKCEAGIGKIIIPPTRRKKACFNIVFQSKKE
jgi:hypothetical protein